MGPDTNAGIQLANWAERPLCGAGIPMSVYGLISTLILWENAPGLITSTSSERDMLLCEMPWDKTAVGQMS